MTQTTYPQWVPTVGPMKVCITDYAHKGEAERQAEGEGLKFASMSNAGLPVGLARMTFLPPSAFVTERDICGDQDDD